MGLSENKRVGLIDLDINFVIYDEGKEMLEDYCEEMCRWRLGDNALELRPPSVALSRYTRSPDDCQADRARNPASYLDRKDLDVRSKAFFYVNYGSVAPFNVHCFCRSGFLLVPRILKEDIDCEDGRSIACDRDSIYERLRRRYSIEHDRFDRNADLEKQTVVLLDQKGLNDDVDCD